MNTKKELREDLNSAQYIIACLSAKVAALEEELAETHNKVATYEETVKEQAEEINTLYVDKRNVEKERDIYKKAYDEAYAEANVLRKQNRELKNKEKEPAEKNNAFYKTCKEYAHNKNYNECKQKANKSLESTLLETFEELFDSGIIGFGIVGK